MSTALSGVPFALRHPKPTAIWTTEWTARRRALLEEAFTSEDLQARFASGALLPEGYGVAMDERVVEWPWLLSQRPSGRLLDAGSCLNHPEVLAAFRPVVDDMHILTLEPEDQAYPQLRISYVFSDLRDLPYRDGHFDCIDSISTLEHVGGDNARYGAGGHRVSEAGPELARALQELKRVLKPGGTLLATVPFGIPDDFGWFRVFDRPAVEALVDAFDPVDAVGTIYRYTADGWQVSDWDGAADAKYRDNATEPQPADLAPNARAVACLRLVK
jgi:SAM-dependent methyltransferase